MDGNNNNTNDSNLFGGHSFNPIDDYIMEDAMGDLQLDSSPNGGSSYPNNNNNNNNTSIPVGPTSSGAPAPAPTKAKAAASTSSGTGRRMLQQHHVALKEKGTPTSGTGIFRSQTCEGLPYSRAVDIDEIKRKQNLFYRQQYGHMYTNGQIPSVRFYVRLEKQVDNPKWVEDLKDVRYSKDNIPFVRASDECLLDAVRNRSRRRPTAASQSSVCSRGSKNSKRHNSNNDNHSTTSSQQQHNHNNNYADDNSSVSSTGTSRSLMNPPIPQEITTATLDGLDGLKYTLSSTLDQWTTRLNPEDESQNGRQLLRDIKQSLDKVVLDWYNEEMKRFNAVSYPSSASVHSARSTGSQSHNSGVFSYPGPFPASRQQLLSGGNHNPNNNASMMNRQQQQASEEAKRRAAIANRSRQKKRPGSKNSQTDNHYSSNATIASSQSLNLPIPEHRKQSFPTNNNNNNFMGGSSSVTGNNNRGSATMMMGNNGRPQPPNSVASGGIHNNRNHPPPPMGQYEHNTSSQQQQFPGAFVDPQQQINFDPIEETAPIDVNSFQEDLLWTHQGESIIDDPVPLNNNGGGDLNPYDIHERAMEVALDRSNHSYDFDGMVQDDALELTLALSRIETKGPPDNR